MVSERADICEREIKFGADGLRDSEILDVLRPALPRHGIRGRRFALLTPATLLDLYVDTPDGVFRESDSTMRFRTAHRKPKFSANFKDPRTPHPTTMVRREVRTTLTAPQVKRAIAGEFTKGAALEACRHHCERVTGTPGLPVSEPVVWVQSSRRVYALTGSGESGVGGILVGIVLEDVVAIAVGAADTNALVDERVLDLDEPRAQVSFRSCEVEIWGAHWGAGDVAEGAFAAVEEAIVARWPTIHETKYARALRLLAGSGGDG